MNIQEYRQLNPALALSGSEVVKYFDNECLLKPLYQFLDFVPELLARRKFVLGLAFSHIKTDLCPLIFGPPPSLG